MKQRKSSAVAVSRQERLVASGSAEAVDLHSTPTIVENENGKRKSWRLRLPGLAVPLAFIAIFAVLAFLAPNLLPFLGQEGSQSGA
jgi:hypothetical protein